ncbi:Hypp6947 [Branchiostoma lanceolatum]|uniref:Hypp6947 protein n=1 Tax=Branchiostoma lanceolatum TaxID=7740 RepID=A0A8J9YVY6_BRALA|nr:Hypp6947 [Branchiostoma lanceolatum]
MGQVGCGGILCPRCQTGDRKIEVTLTVATMVATTAWECFQDYRYCTENNPTSRTITIVQDRRDIEVVDIQAEFNLLKQQIERLQDRSIEGIKDEILQLAARPLPAFDRNRAVALLEALACQARMRAHHKAEEFRYILQQVRPLAHLPRFEDILQDQI